MSLDERLGRAPLVARHSRQQEELIEIEVPARRVLNEFDRGGRRMLTRPVAKQHDWFLYGGRCSRTHDPHPPSASFFAGDKRFTTRSRSAIRLSVVSLFLQLLAGWV